MLVTRAGIHKMLVRIANSEDPDQKQFDLGLHCLSVPLGRQLVFGILEHFPHNFFKILYPTSKIEWIKLSLLLMKSADQDQHFFHPINIGLTENQKFILC